MDDLLIRSRMNLPVTTGIPAVEQRSKDRTQQNQSTRSFQQVLEQTARGQELSFSKHAVERVAMRDIELSSEDIEKLSEGVRIARDKGLSDALILMNGSAFIVSAKNGRVITALDSREATGKVITNINGAVIL